LSRTFPGFESGRRRARFLPALVTRIRNLHATVTLWHTRVRYRRALAQMSERELADIGVSWPAIADEVNKPFWRQ
jgi:uncharacterized protein YjiS (DUF1127 family)